MITKRNLAHGVAEHTIEGPHSYTGVELFIRSKVQSLFCYETSTTEGRGGEKGGSANFKIAHRTFDPRNTSTPVLSQEEVKLLASMSVQNEIKVIIPAQLYQLYTNC